jgi:hypothetical protein
MASILFPHKVIVALPMITVCTSPEHWFHLLHLFNPEVIERHAGLARADTFLNTTDIVAR